MNPGAPHRPHADDPSATPWWRIGMVWLVIGGPLVVVVASLVTTAIAVVGAEEVLTRPVDVKSAIAALEKVLAVVPGHPEAFARLVEIFEREKSKISMDRVEAAYREIHGIEASTPLSRVQRKTLPHVANKLTESRMWDEVGRRVRESAAKVGEVMLQNSRFSKDGNGKFLVIAEDSKIKIKGGAETVIRAMEAAGHSAEPVLVEAAQELASRRKWAGRVRAVFRHGGRILIVVAAANDALYIYYARDKLKAVITVAGGWTGATASAAAFAAWFAPADSAGPWAWAAHGVGTLVAGGVGYWIGSETTRTIYELVAEPEP